MFSQPEVIRRVNAEFVPVALKAWLVNNPPDDEEGRLYRGLRRSMPAPQGICVANSAGKPLDWSLMFDEDKSVLAFLDRGLACFREFPDAQQSLATERFMKFPSAKLPDVNEPRDPTPIPQSHPAGQRCPAQPPRREGTLVARVYGRALDADGKPVADTVRQEHYVEDRFDVPVEMQEALARALGEAGSNRFRVPENFSRLVSSHAFLGQIDVNPFGNPVGEPAEGQGGLKRSEFWAQKIGDSHSPTRLRVEGNSEAVSGIARRSDGASYHHAVKLAWQGFIELNGTRVTRLLLAARGAEKLKWGNENFRATAAEKNDVAHLPGGHFIDLACDVRFGIIGEPLSGAR